MHHGNIEINTNLSTGFDDIERWCAKNDDELVVLYINDCIGDECDQKAHDLVHQREYYVIPDLPTLSNLTVQQAKTLGKFHGNCSIAVLFDFINENYDPSIQCYGTHNLAFYDCRDDKKNAYPFGKMKDNLMMISEKGREEDGKMSME